MSFARINRVYYFAPRLEEAWINASHRDEVFLYIHAGHYSLRLGRAAAFPLDPGDFCRVPRDLRYTLQHREGSPRGFHCAVGFDWTGTAPKSVERGFRDLARARSVRMQDPLKLYDLFGEMHRHARSGSRYAMVHAECILDQITVLALESCFEASIAKPQVWRRILAYVEAHYLQAVTREDIAREFRYTPQHINALFKKHLGVNVNAYVHRLRCFHARDLLLARSHSVKEAAYACGYADPAYFARIFRRHCRLPPHEV